VLSINACKIEESHYTSTTKLRNAPKRLVDFRNMQALYDYLKDISSTKFKKFPCSRWFSGWFHENFHTCEYLQAQINSGIDIEKNKKLLSLHMADAEREYNRAEGNQ